MLGVWCLAFFKAEVFTALIRKLISVIFQTDLTKILKKFTPNLEYHPDF